MDISESQFTLTLINLPNSPIANMIKRLLIIVKIILGNMCLEFKQKLILKKILLVREKAIIRLQSFFKRHISRKEYHKISKLNRHFYILPFTPNINFENLELEIKCTNVKVPILYNRLLKTNIAFIPKNHFKIHPNKLLARLKSNNIFIIDSFYPPYYSKKENKYYNKIDITKYREIITKSKEEFYRKAFNFSIENISKQHSRSCISIDGLRDLKSTLTIN
jgi:hypothetical protein